MEACRSVAWRGGSWRGWRVWEGGEEGGGGGTLWFVAELSA